MPAARVPLNFVCRIRLGTAVQRRFPGLCLACRQGWTGVAHQQDQSPDPPMGWEAVFEEAFGLPVDEFYIEFDTFFDQPGGHMEILHFG